MRAHFMEFKSSTQLWTSMLEDAADFASSVGEERLITIAHSCDSGEALIVVWYWDK